jgi:flagella basal body P-ring formation protein FlgA
MDVKNKLTVFCILSIFCFSKNVMATESENNAAIQKIAQDYISQKVNLKPEEQLAVNVDSSLNMAPCPVPVSVTGNYNENSSGTINLEMTCNATTSWHVFVPVTVSIIGPVVVANHPLSQGQSINETDVDLKKVDRNKLYSGYYTDTKEVIGQVIAVPLGEGTVISNKSIQPQKLVSRNQEVIFEVSATGLVLQMKGIAKNDGILGAPVKVFNHLKKPSRASLLV